MIIQAIPSGPFETNAYIVACPITKEAAIVDPSPDSSEAIIAFIQKNHLHPVKLFLTHSHWDHTADVTAIRSKYPIPIYIHPLDLPNLESPGADGLPSWLNIPSNKADFLLHEGDIIPVGKMKFEVIHTPGHSPGGVCFYCKDEDVLLSGDTLFKGTIGNISFPTSNAQNMWLSLAKLAKLPPLTRVFPGHGASTTIGKETWLANAESIFGN